MRKDKKPFVVRKTKKEIFQRQVELIEMIYKRPLNKEEMSELNRIKLDHRLYRTIGIDIIETQKSEGNFNKVVSFCKEYIDSNRIHSQELIRKGFKGFSLSVGEKIELAKYHIALKYVSLFA